MLIRIMSPAADGEEAEPENGTTKKQAEYGNFS